MPNLKLKYVHLYTHFKTFAGIICDSGAASINDCHVFVEFGITKPNSKNHSSRHRPYNKNMIFVGLNYN
jgi:hypothetical protein